MEEIHVGLFIYTVSADNCCCLHDQCSHHGGDRSSIITVSAKSKEKTAVVHITNVLTVEKTDIASIVYFQYQEHREDKIFDYMIMVFSLEEEEFTLTVPKIKRKQLLLFI